VKTDNGIRVRFCARFENRTDGDIVDRQTCGCYGLGNVVSGIADDGFVAEKFAHGVWRKVVLAEMYAVCPDCEREIDSVIDD